MRSSVIFEDRRTDRTGRRETWVQDSKQKHRPERRPVGQAESQPSQSVFPNTKTLFFECREQASRISLFWHKIVFHFLFLIFFILPRAASGRRAPRSEARGVFATRASHRDESLSPSAILCFSHARRRPSRVAASAVSAARESRRFVSATSAVRARGLFGSGDQSGFSVGGTEMTHDADSVVRGSPSRGRSDDRRSPGVGLGALPSTPKSAGSSRKKQT